MDFLKNLEKNLNKKKKIELVKICMDLQKDLIIEKNLNSRLKANLKHIRSKNNIKGY